MVSKVSRLAALPDPMDDFSEIMDTPAPKLHDAGEVLFKSGVVCWDYEHQMIILHMNKVTGEVTLPQVACKWVSKSEGSLPVLESFATTAERIVNYQLGHESKVARYKPEETLQPYTVKTGTSLRMKTPFVFQSKTSLENTLEVTAWFLASFRSNNQTVWGWESNLRASDRGEDWVICVLPAEESLIRMADHQCAIVRKALEVQDIDIEFC